MHAILFVGMDGVQCEMFRKGFDRRYGNIVFANTWQEAKRLVMQLKIRVIFAEDELPDARGKDVIHDVDGAIPVVLMSKTLMPDRMLEALASGAYDYLIKPIDVKVIGRLCEELERETRFANRSDTPCVHNQTEVPMIIGSCSRMLDVLKTAGLIAKTKATVLIRGESGTGKELFAREIHRVSGRTGAFVALNCAAIAEGLAESELFGHEKGAFTGAQERRAGCFEQANDGTLFLDEIGDAPLTFQAKLLRALDHGEFVRVGGQVPIRTNTRVVAATNKNLENMVDSGEFRLDLFYRLGAMTLVLPALRDRREDIPAVVHALLERLNRHLGCRVKGIAEEALEQLMIYDWPGNMRELQHAIHRAILICRGSVILPIHIQGIARKEEGVKDGIPTLAEVEEEHIKKVLNITRGNRGRTCQLLGISRPTLRRKIRHYKLLPNMQEDVILA